MIIVVVVVVIVMLMNCSILVTVLPQKIVPQRKYRQMKQ